MARDPRRLDVSCQTFSRMTGTRPGSGPPLCPGPRGAAACRNAAPDLTGTRQHPGKTSGPAEQHSHPTYYGAAWDALGQVLLRPSRAACGG